VLIGICCITPEIIAIAVDVPIALTPVCAAAAVDEAAALADWAAFAVVTALAAFEAALAETLKTGWTTLSV
jgi:peroxiredoxin